MGMFLYLCLMLVFVSNVFFLNCLINVIVLFIVWYVIVENFFEILLLIDNFFGKDKWWIVLNFFGFCLGIKLSGDIWRFLNGNVLVENGLVVCFFWILRLIFCWRIFMFFLVDWRLV